MLDKIKAALTKLAQGLMKEFFLTFIYIVISGLMALVIWGILSLLPNQNLYTHLKAELFDSKALLGVFFFAISFGSIYLYRFLSYTLQSTLLKQPEQ